MGEKLKVLTLDLDGKEITITVKRATALAGIRRFQMMIAAEKENEAETDEAAKPLRLFTYPDIISGTAQQNGFAVWPIPFQEFAELDEDLVNDWAAAVYEVNPHWRAGSSKVENEKK